MFPRRKKRSRKPIEWSDAPDIKRDIERLIEMVDLPWLDPDKIFCVRSENANTRAIARIWGLSRVWQIALEVKPSYVLEVVSEYFDKLDETKKDEVLLHELAHIPHNFSGALVPHTKRGKNNFHDKLHSMIVKYHKAK